MITPKYSGILRRRKDWKTAHARFRKAVAVLKRAVASRDPGEIRSARERFESALTVLSAVL